MISPITPQEAAQLLPQTRTIPDELFRVINELILERFDGTNSFDITWEDIRKRITDSHFPWSNDLKFEPYYIKSGWDVKWIKESNYAESGYDRYEFKLKSK